MLIAYLVLLCEFILRIFDFSLFTLLTSALNRDICARLTRQKNLLYLLVIATEIASGSTVLTNFCKFTSVNFFFFFSTMQVLFSIIVVIYSFIFMFLLLLNFIANFVV